MGKVLVPRQELAARGRESPCAMRTTGGLSEDLDPERRPRSSTRRCKPAAIPGHGSASATRCAHPRSTDAWRGYIEKNPSHASTGAHIWPFRDVAGLHIWPCCDVAAREVTPLEAERPLVLGIGAKARPRRRPPPLAFETSGECARLTCRSCATAASFACGHRSSHLEEGPGDPPIARTTRDSASETERAREDSNL
jgi:hypothetical protein